MTNFINGVLYGEDFTFHRGGFSVENGRFSKVWQGDCPVETGTAVDLNGAAVIPGLIDIHFHGGVGEDFTSGTYEGLCRVAAWLLQNGVTSFSIGSVTQTEEVLTKAFCNAARFAKERPQGTSRIEGITMEGPFFSKEKKGAQSEEYLHLPDAGMVERLSGASDGLLRVIAVAPELPGSMEWIERLSGMYRISLGHTAADYDCCREAFSRGASQVTHLFNGMEPLHHRAPGLIAAAAEQESVRAELICDGVHVHESVVRLAFRLFGAERIILVSDGLSVCGLETDGIYGSGEDALLLQNGAAYLTDGETLAGSVTPLFSCMRNAIRFGIAPEDAVRAATANPAEALGAYAHTGSISAGKWADFVVCDADFQIRQVYSEGILADRKERGKI